MLKIYNTLSKKLETFTPIHESIVTFYHCGPTVYWTQHIGNMRGMTMADFIRRTLIYIGYDVKFVRNYTDVGHLTSDGDDGEDKMEKGAKREGLTPQEIADKYIKIFEDDLQSLNHLPIEFKPRASQYVEQMIKMTQILIEKGIAYTTSKAVYYDVTKFDSYTQLSNQKLEFNKSGAGTGDVDDPEKKHPQDFALWFFRTGVHKNAIQYWKSPFNSIEVQDGLGFPGWHIECSAMSSELLGETIDIHMGGIEHIPVHHTNEIAQSEGASGKKFVNYWLHNEHLLVDNEKMSKSLGNVNSVEEIKAKGYDPMVLRYFFMSAHYRSKQNFTWEAMDASKVAYEKLLRRVSELKILVGADNSNRLPNVEFKAKFISELENDFNISGALSVVWELLKVDMSDAEKLSTLLDFDRVLGIRLEENADKLATENSLDSISSEIKEIMKQRQLARDTKDWKKSDDLRDQLKNDFHVLVEDTSEGQKITRI